MGYGNLVQETLTCCVAEARAGRHTTTAPVTTSPLLVPANTGYFCMQVTNETQHNTTLVWLHLDKDTLPASVLMQDFGCKLSSSLNRVIEKRGFCPVRLENHKDFHPSIPDPLTQYGKV